MSNQLHNSRKSPRSLHPTALAARLLAFECSIFAVGSRPALQLLVLNPATLKDRRRVESLTPKSVAKKKRRTLRKLRA